MRVLMSQTTVPSHVMQCPAGVYNPATEGYKSCLSERIAHCEQRIIAAGGVVPRENVPSKERSMAIDLYCFQPSAPSWVVLLVAKALDIHLNIKAVDIFHGEQFSPEFTKINPVQKIPVIDDDGFILSESLAIIAYFVDKYAKDDSLYPKDLKKRAKINQMLFFDCGTFVRSIRNYLEPVVEDQLPPENSFKDIEKSVGYLDRLLEGQEWVAGEQMSIADYSLVVYVTVSEATGVDVSKYPNLERWFSKAKNSVAGYEECKTTLKTSGEAFLEAVFKKHKVVKEEPVTK